MADRAVEELRERRAAYECGDEISKTEEAVSSSAAEVKTVAKNTRPKLEVNEAELKKSVSKQRRKGMSADEFEDLWRGALGDVMGREEVEVKHDR